MTKILTHNLYKRCIGRGILHGNTEELFLQNKLSSRHSDSEFCLWYTGKVQSEVFVYDHMDGSLFVVKLMRVFALCLLSLWTSQQAQEDSKTVKLWRFYSHTVTNEVNFRNWFLFGASNIISFTKSTFVKTKCWRACLHLELWKLWSVQQFFAKILYESVCTRGQVSKSLSV